MLPREVPWSTQNTRDELGPNGVIPLRNIVENVPVARNVTRSVNHEDSWFGDVEGKLQMQFWGDISLKWGKRDLINDEGCDAAQSGIRGDFDFY